MFTATDFQVEPETCLVDLQAARGAPVHWLVKLCIKLAISRSPVSYRLWRRVGIFRHGSPMEHFQTAQHKLQRALDFHSTHGGGEVSRLLELGPGDSLALAIPAVTRSIRCDFVDVGDFAVYELGRYTELAERCERDVGASVFQNIDFSTRESLLRSIGASYGVQGLQSLKELPANSIDVSLSTVVLEHIRVDEFDETLAELFRIMRPGGTGQHYIDVMDHLGGRLNNLRFSRGIWEAPFMATSGFYTNRLRPSEIIQRATAAGFQTSIIRMQKFPSIPTSRKLMSEEFRQFADSDFEIAAFELALRKP